jgi:prepilin-type N-terminal cleavage/methylation domain-containing protein
MKVERYMRKFAIGIYFAYPPLQSDRKTKTSLRRLHEREVRKNMRWTDFLKTLLIRGHSRQRARAFTLIEILIAMAIVGTLGGIAVPTYKSRVDEQNVSTAIADIAMIDGWVARFQAERGRPPDTLAETGLPAKLDPWGHPYGYTRLAGLSKADQDAKCRWDKNEKPLNADYDLYSMGKDGVTKPKITHADAHDDIIRAHGGAYVGLASEY